MKMLLVNAKLALFLVSPEFLCFSAPEIID